MLYVMLSYIDIIFLSHLGVADIITLSQNFFSSPKNKDIFYVTTMPLLYLRKLAVIPEVKFQGD